ncbi:GrpB domain protein [Xylariaceae sp. FL1019]|nr:GrpB domain protein [Xylariaceae sp. FL1019]
MSSTTLKLATPEEIITFAPDDGTGFERVNHRAGGPVALEIEEYNPDWPEKYALVDERIRKALGNRALLVQHTGSTSVPGLPAKAVLDVDLIVADNEAEETYRADLEAAGFILLHREEWYKHRFFYMPEPLTNLHVFGPGPRSAEAVRHRLFRDWLREHPEDRENYAEIKRTATKASREGGEDVNAYTRRKGPVISDILRRIFETEGFLPKSS